MKTEKPDWKIPDNIQSLLDSDEYGIWDDESWSPFLLSVMSGTEYNGRAIPLVWQIEFEPSSNEFEQSNKNFEELEIEPDGYGWATIIKSIVEKYHSEIVDQLQFGDTEAATCVIWVEDEKTCETLMNVLWNMVYGTK